MVGGVKLTYPPIWVKLLSKLMCIADQFLMNIPLYIGLIFMHEFLLHEYLNQPMENKRKAQR